MAISDIVSAKKEAAIQALRDRLAAEQQAHADAAAALAQTQYGVSVTSAWIGYTGWPPSQSERDQWVTLLANGAPAELLYQFLANQPEYRVLRSDPNRLIDAVFQNLFGRAATPAEKSYWWGAAADYRFVPTVVNAAQGGNATVLSEKVLFSDLALPLVGTGDPSDIQYRQLFD